jgi:hypothetical protein
MQMGDEMSGDRAQRNLLLEQSNGGPLAEVENQPFRPGLDQCRRAEGGQTRCRRSSPQQVTLISAASPRPIREKTTSAAIVTASVEVGRMFSPLGNLIGHFAA